MKTITQKEYIIYFFISLCFVAFNFATIKTLLPWVSYIQYNVSPAVMERIGSPYLYITSVFVLAGLIRYLQITIVDVKSGSPTKVLMKDRFIQLCIVGWILTFFIILYIE